MKLIQRGLFRLCFSTIVLIKIKTRYILKKAIPKAFRKYKVPATFEGFVASLKKLQYNFPKMRGGESKAIWNFSENPSVLEAPHVPYIRSIVSASGFLSFGDWWLTVYSSRRLPW